MHFWKSYFSIGGLSTEAQDGHPISTFQFPLPTFYFAYSSSILHFPFYFPLPLSISFIFHFHIPFLGCPSWASVKKSLLHVPQCFASSCVCSVEKEYSLGMSDWTGSDSEGSDKENHDHRCRDDDDFQQPTRKKHRLDLALKKDSGKLGKNRQFPLRI